MSILRWSFLLIGLLVYGCASMMEPSGFTFTPVTDEVFDKVEETRLYRCGLGEPHRVIGEVSILGEPDEPQEVLEKRLLDSAGGVGAQGVIIVQTEHVVSEVGETGIRHDSFGGAAKQYRFYPLSIPIEEERIYIRGIAIRLMEE